MTPVASLVARVEPAWSLESWRSSARVAIAERIPPQHVEWQAGAQYGLALGAPNGRNVDSIAKITTKALPVGTVPAALIDLAAAVTCHREPRRHALLYRLLWRIVAGERQLLDRATDPDVIDATVLAQAVRRDTHKMKAFVRFRRLPVENEAFVAWFEPDHFIVDRVAPFFARRFAGMRWAILTPYRSARWDGSDLQFGPGATRSDAPTEDAQEELWRTYYANIFNPARINPKMMQQEMPRKYWKGLPEASLLPSLLRDAGHRVEEMRRREPEAPRRKIPERTQAIASHVRGSLDAARSAAHDCRRCDLWQPATQTVWGEGPHDARIMVIGEQPGDEEDLSGRPFVGPAGKVLDRALIEVGIARSECYVTNAVKHFRFEQRGKVRLHKKADAGQVRACHGWLEQELGTVLPDIIVCLGATAAAAIFGPSFRLMQERGRLSVLGNGSRALATVHPSWVLRQGKGMERESAFAGFVADLREVSVSASRV